MFALPCFYPLGFFFLFFSSHCYDSLLPLVNVVQLCLKTQLEFVVEDSQGQGITFWTY
jgi:hypothetical protein